MRSPAISSEPWASAYGEELFQFQVQDPEYVPFQIQGFHAFHGRYINTDDVERETYRSRTPPNGRPLRVAFFGGSAMFGIGQRDDFTIPSDFVKVAERSGVDIEAHNYGYLARVSWQEFVDFEQRLAAGERYDLAVFYDGFNDVHYQSERLSRNPTHNGVSVLQNLAESFHEENMREPGFLDGVHDLLAAWADASGVVRLSEYARSELSPTETPASTTSATPQAQAEAALEIYARTHRLIALLADSYGIPVRFFWQPTRAGWPASITDHLPDGVTDLSHALDGREDDLYIDEVHTNEEGARLLAEAMWDEIGPELTRAVPADD